MKAICEAAAAVVKAYDRLDWDKIETTAELDVVFLTFATADGLESADDLIHKVAFANGICRKQTIAEFKRFRRVYLLPLRKYLSAHWNPQRFNETSQIQSNRATPNLSPVLFRKLMEIEPNYRQLLQRLIEYHMASDVHQFHRTWQKLNENLAELGKLPQVRFKVDPPPIPPIGIMPVRIGGKDPACLRLSIPLRFFLAEPIVGLCRRLSRINTGLRKISISRELSDCAGKYYNLFNHCQLESFHLPHDDAGPNPPQLPELQEKTEEAFDALKGFLKLVFDPPATATTMKDCDQSHAAGASGSNPPAVPLAEVIPVQAPPKLVVTIESFTEIRILGIGMIRSKSAKHALLGLAVIASESNQTGTKISFLTKVLVGLISGSLVKTPQAWSRLRNALRAELPDLEINGHQGEYTINNLHFEKSLVITDDIKKYLKSLPSKGRAHISKLSKLRQ